MERRGVVRAPDDPGGAPEASAFAVFDDGSGPALYVGFLGAVSLTGGMTLGCIGRWDGTSWSTLGPGLNGAVRALDVFDDGSGPALYAGGEFYASGSTSLNRVARWNGVEWSSLGGGLSGYSGGFQPVVRGLRTWTTGPAPGLYAVGSFATAGAIAASNVARWTGSTWTALGAGVSWAAFDALPYDDGSGPALFVSGQFPMAGGVPASGIARWNGAAWSALGSGLGGWLGGSWSAVGGPMAGASHGLQVFDDGTGPALYVGGQSTAGSGVLRWNGTSWSSLPSWGADWQVHAFASGNFGAPTIFAGGGFRRIGGIVAPSVAGYAGGQWFSLGSGVSLYGVVRALCTFDHGTGPELYAGGTFTSLGGVAAASIARWNGSTWSDVLGGVSGGFPSAGGLLLGSVRAMTVFDEGSGSRLIVCGNFSTAGGVVAHHIAAWDGSAWFPMGGIPGAEDRALLVADAGAGPELYAAGVIAGTSYGFVAKRSGGGWQILGTSTGPAVNVGATSLAFYDDGSGPALYVGGAFSSMNGQPVTNVARFDGAWTPASPQLAAGAGGVESLAVYDDGSGLTLYGCGSPFMGPPSVLMARRTGPTSWSAVGGDVTDEYNCVGNTLAVLDDGAGPALYVGGCVEAAGGIQSARIARWGPLRPQVHVTQAGGSGTPVTVRNTWLRKGREYHNIFSDSSCGTLGAGPYLGLCAPDPAFLTAQFNLPVGAVPFHFQTPLGSMTFGGYQLPPGLALDVVCFDYTGGVLGCVSPVARITVQ